MTEKEGKICLNTEKDDLVELNLQIRLIDCIKVYVYVFRLLDYDRETDGWKDGRDRQTDLCNLACTF